MKSLKYLLIQLFISVWKTIYFVDAECLTTSNDGKRFGDSCRFLCHCKDKTEQCDSLTGECTRSGCAGGWMGQGCQYRDMAFKQEAKHLDDLTRNPKHAGRAVDGNRGTCSETAKAAAARSQAPFWKVWLQTEELISGVTLVTKKTRFKDYFRSFQILVENVPESEKDNITYRPENSSVCYSHTDDLSLKSPMNVSCVRPLIGNQVRLQLFERHSQIILCEVQVYGVCPEGRWGENCSRTCGHCAGGNCNAQTGACSGGCLPGYKDTALCKDVCFPGTWGHGCTSRCGECSNGTCNAADGRCFGGCKPGYIEDNHCKTECSHGTWGLHCAGKCGECSTGTCNVVDGRCSGGCKPGYTEASHCKEDCETGHYGMNCLYNCSGNCINGEECDKRSGNCTNGCEPGFTGVRCAENCEPGQYGLSCQYNCSGSCFNGEECDKRSGNCSNGCEPGFTGARCTERLLKLNKDNSIFPTSMIASGVAALLGLVIITAVVVVIVRKRQANSMTRTASQIQAPTEQSDGILFNPYEEINPYEVLDVSSRYTSYATIHPTTIELQNVESVSAEQG